ncbi:MAG TPA: DUF2798 domain-containing protein [Pseudomonas sp.]|jgi:hypothetical protein|uniref:DUF2798 domain-containing protein n=1 Tax=Pseudomonas helleri TaxID=1608996 RepID=A0A6L5HN23_9PSED|nr:MULTISPECIES: DUF2798 domain-containing protein [Pseudomonas]MCU1756449.1 DUF2798 domain-containing protein [Pseudomonas helleri]MQU04746.1 DUF2798 domain-containing protein [Pseudomonas helleri]MQU63921.1 DUF2798 domain-containing protein [Pseudomonas sp. FSL R10-1350]HCN65801.1 DUF2798 domain-containing protein [Pseudomonas sp.]
MNAKSTSNTLISSRLKFSVRATPYVFALYMSTIMAFLMSLVITAANTGIDADYLNNTLQAYKLAMPAAFLCILVVRPIVIKLVAMTVHPHR